MVKTSKLNHEIFAMTLTGKVAIVTGAGQGIGLEICRKLIQSGAHVILNDADHDLAEQRSSELKGKGTCHAVSGDASDLQLIDRMVSFAVNQFGRLDIAIANAGITLFGEFLNYRPEDFFQVMKVNLGGTFFLAQAAAKQMKQQQNGGSLLFMSSVTGHQAHEQLAAYGMTKAGVEMLARSLVVELSKYKINVNAIAPGATITERTMADKEYATVWSKLTPMGRAANVDDIAHAALFLVSDEAKQITGQTLIIDGGWSCVSPSPY